MGMTIPELLETFCSHISRLCEESRDSDMDQKPLQQSLIQAIGSLSINPNYPGQTNDILLFLICKLEVPMSHLPTDSDRYLVCILDSLSHTLKCNIDASSAEPSIHRSRLSFIPTSIACDICMSIISLINHHSTDVRVAVSEVINLLLEIWIMESRLLKEHESPKRKADIEAFATLLRNTLYLLLKGGSVPVDYAIFGLLMLQLLELKMYNELVFSIPLIFNLEVWNI